MPVQPKHKVGRNSPCPCGSKLKFKKCHGDPMKQAVCNRVANEKMVELIRIEQRKYIIAEQQKECYICGNTGEVDFGKKCSCQFITDEDRIAYEYKLSKEKEKNGEETEIQ